MGAQGLFGGSLSFRRKVTLALFGLSVPAALWGGSLAFRQATAASTPVIHVLSTRADLVTGGQALISVTVGTTSPRSALMVLNGKDVSHEFALRRNGQYEGLLTGMRGGRNELDAYTSNVGAKIIITDHPTGGPVFSGPQIKPWFCEAGAIDALCNKPTTYAYQYKSASNGQFMAYDPKNPPPATDVASTTTDNGKTVPYIIRIETGYADRDEYQIAVLFRPGKSWTPWSPQSQWDTKIEIPGGAS